MIFNPYSILGVDSSMSLEEVKKEYRKLAKAYHPDKPNGDAEKFKMINEAWKIIKSQKESNNTVKVGSEVGRFRPVTHISLFKFRRI